MVTKLFEKWSQKIFLQADRETLAENRVGVGERRYCEVIEVIEAVEQSSLLSSRPFSLVRYFTARSVTFFAHLH